MTEPSHSGPHPVSSDALTVVIVNWNGGDLLLKCLETVRASKTTFPVSVIVVDNNSRDGSREEAQKTFPEFHIFNSGSNLGFGRANNLARTLVNTPQVLFLNPDTELLPNSLENAVASLRTRPDVGILGCKMRYPGGQVQQLGLQWTPTPWTVFLELLFLGGPTRRLFRSLLPTHDPEKSGYVSKLYGGFFLCPKEALEQTGWFDDRYFMYAEDVDLCESMKKTGWKLYYCANSEIIHIAGGTSRKAPSNFSILMKCTSIGQFMRKHYGAMGAVLYRAAVFLASLLRLVLLTVASFVMPAVGEDTRNRIRSAFKSPFVSILWSLGLRKACPP